MSLDSGIRMEIVLEKEKGSRAKYVGMRKHILFAEGSSISGSQFQYFNQIT